MRDFKVGDILVCKKSNTSNNQHLTWYPIMEMHKDTKYKVEVVEDYDIKVTDFNFIDPSYEYFGYDEEGPDHWEKWFYTISELRDEKLNELGI